MALNVSLGTIGEDPRCLTKKPTWSKSGVSCEVYENCSVINPVLILDYDAAYTSCNYLRINAWGRYYFIERIDLQPGGKAIIYAHCDVLYTYSSELKSIQFRLSRSESDFDSSIPDPQYTYAIQYDTIYANNQLSGEQSNLFDGTTSSSKCIVLGVAGASNDHFYDVTGFTIHTTEPTTYAGGYRYYYINVGSASVIPSTNANNNSIPASISKGKFSTNTFTVCLIISGSISIKLGNASVIP